MRRAAKGSNNIFRLAATLTFRVLAVAWVVTLAASPTLCQQDACNKFRQALKTTYDFKPSKLSEADRTAKSAQMDGLWSMVKRNKEELIPCLRAAVGDPKSDAWFRFDGSNLLVTVDPSPESKLEQIRQYAAVDLNDVDLRFWVGIIAKRGTEGFDVADAGAHWLSFPNAEYYLPEHGAFKVDSLLGAFFIYGSMDESQATPALLKMASDPSHPAREKALAILLFQATPESFRALKIVNKTGLTIQAQSALLLMLENPRRVTPRDKPKTSREEFLKAFKAYVDGDGEPFLNLVTQVPDGERDVVAVLKPEDVPLIRKIRRRMIATGNQHSFEFYKTFTEILMTLVWRPELVK